MTAVFRFAPSPNGFLHLGHALSALVNERMARSVDGRLVLRIEDIDRDRSREGFVTAIHEDLAWLGLRLEEQRRQSLGTADYRAALGRLAGLGLVYRSPASRSAIAAAVADAERTSGVRFPRDPDGAPRYRRGLVSGDYEGAGVDPSGAATAIRLDMRAAIGAIGTERLTYNSIDEAMSRIDPVACEPAVWGDVVLARKGLDASYPLAVVVDDAALGVTHVVRGLDLEPATSLQRLLQVLLGLPAPLYHHHRLVKGADGRKLSKSEGAKGLRALRDAGVDADAIRRDLGYVSR